MTRANKNSKRGGARPGAGRPRGSKSKKTLMKEELHNEVMTRAVETAETPLEVMLAIMRDPDSGASMRFEAAKAAAPYIHPRLSHTDSKVSQETTHYVVSDTEMSEDEWASTYSNESDHPIN